MILWLASLAGCSAGPPDLPTPTFHQLSNGLKLFVLEDSALPTFRLSLLGPAGSVFDEPGKEGVAALTAELVRTGGTASLSPAEVEAKIGRAGADLEMKVEREGGVVSLRSLADDRRDMLRLLGEMLHAPRFDPVAFAVAKRQAFVSLQTIRDDPLDLVSRHFASLIYGSNSPWARVPTEQSLKAIEIADLKTFYKKYYHRSQMILAAAGDFKTKELLAELTEAFGAETPSEPPPPIWPDAASQDRQAVLIPKELQQATIQLGHLGSTRDNPDKFALLVANFILGGSGSLTSRLGIAIRSGQGQAYSVWSQFGFGRVPGIFAMTAQTDATQTTAVLAAMQQILVRLQEEGPLEQEIADAKTAILRSLLFEYETRYQIASDTALFEFRGYPRNYLGQFIRGISEVEGADVRRVLKKYFRTDALSLLVIGPPGIESSLQQKWPVAFGRIPEERL